MDNSERVTSSGSFVSPNDLISIVKDKPEVAFLNNLESNIVRMKDAVDKSVPIRDAYNNSLLAVGGDDPRAAFNTETLSNDTLNWMLWLCLYQDSWVFRRAINKPAQDEIRCGIKIVSDSTTEQDFDPLYRTIKSLRSNLIDILKWGALFGGSIGCLMFDNFKDEDYALPLNVEKLKQAKTIRMYVVDRWYGVSPSYGNTVTEMSDLDFGKPKYYNVTMSDGSQIKFHHDYVLRYEHTRPPQFIQRGLVQGWGYAEGTHIIQALTQDEKLKASVLSLIDKASIEVIKMAGMRGVFMSTDPANSEQLKKRLEMVNWGRNFNSLTFLDKEDEYDQREFSGISGLSDLLETNMWLISAALEMQGVLFGDLKQGFSDDRNSLERYAETINGRCEDLVRPVYRKLLWVLCQKYGLNTVEFEFNSLLEAQHQVDAVTNVKSFVDLGTSLLDTGVIDLPKFATGLNNYLKRGTIDFGIDDQYIATLEQTQQEQMEITPEQLMGE